MRGRGLTGAILPALLAMALLGTVSCDDDEPEDREGRRLTLSASPSRIHLVVDPSGTSTVGATLADLNRVALKDETIEFSVTPTPPGTLSADMDVTDDFGTASVTFSLTTPSETTATVTATNPTTSLASLVVISVLDEDLGDHQLATLDSILAECTDTVALTGTLEDTNGIPVRDAAITFEIASVTVDGMPPTMPLTGAFTPTSTTTSSSGGYSTTFALTEAECSAQCVGAAACEVIVRAIATATSSTLDSNTVTITEGF